MSQGKKDTEGRGNCRNQGRKMQTSLVFWEPQVSATSLGLNMWCHETLNRPIVTFLSLEKKVMELDEEKQKLGLMPF